MNRLFRSIAIALFIPILILPAPSLARDKTDNVQFFCGRVNQDGKIIPTTQAVSSGTVDPVSLIFWKYTPPKGMTNRQRCETVSKRFQLAWDRGTFDKLIVGIDKKTGLGLICAVPYTEKQCTRSHLLFTLSTGSDAEEIRDRLRNTLSGPGKGSPLSQSSGENEIDMQLLIDRLKNK
ncbi:COP23 domain-containing protein [Chamaesiphon sp. VAR_48_metabat_403]|uniref:COP23 domain-containing protein n=1 Tax=Chamaesiphon sp. VAR_48_metabat_403 TaxID=2964700 RepID=UPI00286EAA55|nr:COP23 domain-containing protein [Chamaesiphon sp. VAR_48_metabat_403]